MNHVATLIRVHDDSSAYGCHCGRFVAAGPTAAAEFNAHRAYQVAAASLARIVNTSTVRPARGVEAAATTGGAG